MSLEKVQKREEKSGFLKKFSYFFVLFVGLSAVASPKIANADFFSGLDVNKENHRVPEPSNIENLLNVNGESGKQGISNALQRYLLHKSMIELEIKTLKNKLKDGRLGFGIGSELKIKEIKKYEKSLKLLESDFFWEVIEKLETFDLKQAKTSDQNHAFKKFKIILHIFEGNHGKNEIYLKECNLKLKGTMSFSKLDTVQNIKQRKRKTEQKIQGETEEFIKRVYRNTPNGEKSLINNPDHNYRGGIYNLPDIPPSFYF